jgi:hypothetical protein
MQPGPSLCLNRAVHFPEHCALRQPVDGFSSNEIVDRAVLRAAYCASETFKTPMSDGEAAMIGTSGGEIGRNGGAGPGGTRAGQLGSGVGAMGGGLGSGGTRAGQAGGGAKNRGVGTGHRSGSLLRHSFLG